MGFPMGLGEKSLKNMYTNMAAQAGASSWKKDGNRVGWGKKRIL